MEATDPILLESIIDHEAPWEVVRDWESIVRKIKGKGSMVRPVRIRKGDRDRGSNVRKKGSIIKKDKIQNRRSIRSAVADPLPCGGEVWIGEG